MQKHKVWIPIYALTILAGAFLLFAVEPVIGKIVLPWFGGSAAVWTACLLFFQMALLAGYLYAHALVRYVKPRAQAPLHVALLAVSALTLAVYPSASLQPHAAGDPTWNILLLLLRTIGLPFFLLAATGPLVQAWYARRFAGSLPYWLYALSNAGSLVALVAYPVLIEPVYTTHEQACLWSLGYLGFALVCAAAALGSRAVPEAMPEPAGAAKPTRRQYALWLALPACASALLLAVTNHMSQNVAAVPFLWILPLSLYLLSFIVCFAGHGCYRRSPFLQLLAVALGSMAYAITEGNLPIVIVVLLFSLGLFLCAMACHGELALLKPQPRYLTHFYLTISAGGALGGLAVGLVSPHVFNGYYEMPLGLVGCAGLILAVLKTDPALPWFRRWTQPAPIAAVVLTLALAVYGAIDWQQSRSGVRLRVRNFYGELTVKDSDPPTAIDAVRTLLHGTITHGDQFLNPALRDVPTTYYGAATGVGIAIRDRAKQHAVRIGVIGLGTGTLAAYARPGDYYRYYEINPLVVQVARSQFSFLARCRGKLEIAMGDARLSLAREQPENFDVLAVDAFSSDSIPVHLLTSQAMDLYFRHLRPDGILAVHISNHHLDLEPIVAGEAHASGRRVRVVDTEDDDDRGVFAATWVLVAAPPGDFDNDVRASSNPVPRARRVRLWTDDYSNLFQILK
jgi:hypothetical protein